ncbi:MAG: DUF4115 domain-containing protein [Alphaproteobacteria bacterium]|nr:DUF4115 domain-containing protein [Alphaproteobacteria bacterium]MBN2675004.1 DUF4115 domain-containing protein [Alphaproteobacteria bacterium]
MTERNKELTAAQMLFEARTSGRRKREISTISRLLCIREEYLVALENGKYDMIPEMVYVLGFARNYAMELGLDPTEIVSKIKKEMGIENELESGYIDASDEETERNMLNSENITKKNPKQTNMAFEKLSKYLYKNWKWLVASLVAVLILIFGVSFIISLGNESDAYNNEETVVAVVKEPGYKHPIREKFGTENSSTANVVIQANQESWVKIEDARGNTVFSRVLVTGDVYYVPAGEKYKGTFGNAGGIDIWVNGKLIPKLGSVNTRKSGVIMTPDALMPSPDVSSDTKE